MILRMVCVRGNGADALVLALGSERMRVMPSGSTDAVELTLVDGVWKDECGQAVEFDFMGTISARAADICSELFPLFSSVGI